MKRIKNIVLGFSVFMVIACSSDDDLNDVLDNTEFGIAMRSIDEDNGFDLSNLSSEYRNQFEIDAVDEGFQPESIRVLIGFTDDDETDDDPANSMSATQFSTLDPASFTETTTLTTHNLPVGTFSITLQQAIDFLGLTTSDYDRGDAIEFEFEMVTTDGTVFTSTNVGTNVAASGRFSFYNSPYAYTAVIDDPNRVVLSSAELGEFSSDVLRQGSVDSVMLVFDSGTLLTNPTITRTSAGGNTDDVIGAIQKLPFEDVDEDGTDDNENTFFFLYTAGSAASDDVTFDITGAETVSGFPMEPVTFEKAFSIDNVAPNAILGGASGVFTDDGSQIDKVSVDLIFSEDLSGDVTYTITSAQFDDQVITQEVEDGVEATIDIRPRLAGALIPSGNLVFTVAVSGADNTDGTDAAGNAVVGNIVVNIF